MVLLFTMEGKICALFPCDAWSAWRERWAGGSRGFLQCNEREKSTFSQKDFLKHQDSQIFYSEKPTVHNRYNLLFRQNRSFGVSGRLLLAPNSLLTPIKLTVINLERIRLPSVMDRHRFNDFYSFWKIIIPFWLPVLFATVSVYIVLSLCQRHGCQNFHFFGQYIEIFIKKSTEI